MATQLDKLRTLLLPGEWWSLAELERATGIGQSSIGSQLRNLRLREQGHHLVVKRLRDGAAKRVWEYRLEPKPHVPGLFDELKEEQDGDQNQV